MSPRKAVPSDKYTMRCVVSVTVIAGFVLFRRDTSGKLEYLLLEKQFEHGHWSPPKGHAEGEETPVEAAYREVREETSLLPQHYKVMLDLHEYFEYEKEDGTLKQVSLWPAELTELDHPIVVSKEHRDFRWVNIDETLQLVKTQFKQSFAGLNQKLCSHFDTPDC